MVSIVELHPQYTPQALPDQRASCPISDTLSVCGRSYFIRTLAMRSGDFRKTREACSGEVSSGCKWTRSLECLIHVPCLPLLWALARFEFRVRAGLTGRS